MFLPGRKFLLSILIALFFAQFSIAQSSADKEDKQVLEDGIRVLRNYFYEDHNWHLQKPELQNDVNGLIHFIEDAPIDTVLLNLDKARQNDGFFVYRLPEDVEDSLSVPGYSDAAATQLAIQKIQADLLKQVQQNPYPVPMEVIERARLLAPTIPEGKGMILVTDSLIQIPDELNIPDVIPDSILNSPEQFRQLVKIDSLRNAYVEQKRQEYNAAVNMEAIEKASGQYRAQMFEDQLNFRIKRYRDSVELRNYEVLRAHNDSVMRSVNDSIRAVIGVLGSYANFIDSTTLTLVNRVGEKSDIVLKNGNENFARIWLKNEQNDSLLVLVKSTDKRGIQMLINDGVTFSRFSARQTKNFDFESLKMDYSRFSNVGKSYELETPWRIGGDGSVGFTQTYYENWKKGGESALSLLMILKGFANYSSHDGKIKWENNAEIRNGWLRPGDKNSELKKTDDKLELTTRFGLKAVNKWYYSTELTYNTQFFKGYKYPKADNPAPISAFMAPSKTIFKIGLDYKPSSEFSLFLSPLSVKNVYVRDTSLIDQTKYGVEADKKAFWEPGLNTDVKFKKQITSDLLFETKYKMFINYKDPFRKLDIDWENNLKLQLTTYFDLKMMVHLLYDDNVLFPVYAKDGETQIGEKAKLQIEEFITIGFTYKINKQVMHTRRIR